MNGYQRIQAALHGTKPDTVPIMLHNFQMAAREYGITAERFRGDPVALAGAFIDSVERYKYDGIVVDIDTVTLAGAAGVPVDFPADEPARPSGARLHSIRDVKSLPPVDLRTSERVQVWLEATRLLKQHFDGEVFVRGNCDQCPFSLAAMIRGMDGWLMDLLDLDLQEEVRLLLDYCTDITVHFVRMMAETGADMVSNGDSVAGTNVVSPDIYRRYALPSEQTVARAAHDLGLPYVLHICGNAGPILVDMMASGADGLELDQQTDALQANHLMRDDVVFIGNIDPSAVLARGTPDEVARTTGALVRLFSNTPRFVLNAGCAIPPTTPSENLHTMIRTARQFRP